jgi:iron(III) transport system substrate-binding protein
MLLVPRRSGVGGATLGGLVAGWLVLAAACATAQSPTSAPAAAPLGSSPSAAPGGAAAQPVPGATNYDHPVWKQLIEAARREGKLVVAANPNPEIRERIPRYFKDRFGVEIEFVIGRSHELLTRLQSERASGLYTIDVVVSGGDSGSQMYSDGWLQPMRPLLVVPEVADPSLWRGNRLPFIDPEQQYSIQLEQSVTGIWVINPQLVNESEVRTLDDVVNPKWRGKISMEDPLVTGLGPNNAIYIYLEKGEHYFRKLFVDQEPAISREDRQKEDWLARGSHPISFGLAPKNVDQMVRQGLPAKNVGLLGGRGWLRGPSFALLSNAPHPASMALFTNWITSPEGMRMHAEAEQLVPMRKDVDHSWSPEVLVPKEGVDYLLNADDFTFLSDKKPGIMARIREILTK